MPLRFYCIDCLHSALLRDEQNYNRTTPHGTKALKVYCHETEFEVVIPRIILDRKGDIIIYVGKDLPETNLGDWAKGMPVKPKTVRKLML